MTRKRPTALQESAVNFVALLAEQVDKERGVIVPNGTKETQIKIAEIVREITLKPHGLDK